MTVTTYNTLEQGSEEWLAARCGLVTASTVGKLLTATGKVAENDISRGFTISLIAERITKHVEQGYVSDDMFRGILEEPLARNAYAKHRRVEVAEVGFITKCFHDDFTLGYSPDGLVGDDGLIEIKSRRQKKHVQTILADEVPPENMPQLQAGLLVTGRAWIDYCSYSGGLPLWIKRVEPNEKWFAAISDAAEKFELTAAEMVAKYQAAVVGLPVMERTVDLEEMRV